MNQSDIAVVLIVVRYEINPYAHRWINEETWYISIMENYSAIIQKDNPSKENGPQGRMPSKVKLARPRSTSAMFSFLCGC